jgi:hypothetical protein
VPVRFRPLVPIFKSSEFIGYSVYERNPSRCRDLPGDGDQALDLSIGFKVFMDARVPVTHKEGDRYPLKPPNYEKIMDTVGKSPRRKGRR